MSEAAAQKPTLRIAATLIVLDKDQEHEHLARLFASTKVAGVTDYVVGVDEKSAEGTAQWIEEHLRTLVDVGQVVVFPYVIEVDGVEDFARARNLTLERVPKEVHFWLWIDADDTLEMPAGRTLPELLEDLDPQWMGLQAPYLYDFDQWGNCSTRISRARVLRNAIGWEWKNPVHEDVKPTDDSPRLLLKTDALVWRHHPQAKGRVWSIERNFRILRRWLEREPENPKVYYYLGNQHFSARNWEECARAYEEYIHRSYWDDEKYIACIYQAIAYRELGMLNEAIKSDNRAMNLKPEWPDAYFGLGETKAKKGDWEQSRYWTELGIQRVGAGTLPNDMVFVNELAWRFKPYTWLTRVYFNLGEFDMALRAYDQAIAVRPEPELLYEREHLRWAMRRRKSAELGISLAGYLLNVNEPLKARAVLEALPAGIGDNDPGVQNARAKVERITSHLRDDVAYRQAYMAGPETVDPFEWLKAGEAHGPGWFPRLEWILERIQRAGARRVLEVGVGNALPSLYYAKQGGVQVVGIDVDPHRVRDGNWNAVKARLLGTHKGDVEVLGEKFRRRVPNITPESRVQFHWYDGKNIPAVVQALAPFDVVIAAEVLEHVRDDQAFLDMIEPLGARLIVTVPDGSYDGPQRFDEDHPFHVRMYSQQELGRAVLFPKVDDRPLLEDLARAAGRAFALGALEADKRAMDEPAVAEFDAAFERLQKVKERRALIEEAERKKEPTAARGRIVELHKVTPGGAQQPNLVLEYVPGQRQEHTPPVVIWCPNTDQKWSPDSLRRGGVGGSETAVIRVAEELAARGLRVTVYSEAEGVWNGVLYQPVERFRPFPCWMFVSWRTVGPLAEMADFAQHRWLWTHDVHFGRATEEQLRGVKVLALSDWHEGFLREAYGDPPLDIVRTANGIDPARFDRKVKRKPHRLIYAQSPDRGLDIVLREFPKVRERWPDAELHIFYGFELARRMGKGAFVDRVLRAAAQPGVTVHGKVDQRRLAEEYLRSDALIYPSTMPDGEPFKETYCISVVEAQAAGCIPVTVSWGALSETNKHGILVDKVEDLVPALSELWSQPQKQQRERRRRAAEWAREQTWSRVAEGWLRVAGEADAQRALTAGEEQPAAEDTPTPAA